MPFIFSAPLAAFTDDLPDEDEEGSGGIGVDAHMDMEAGASEGGCDGGEGGGLHGHSSNLHREHSSQVKGSQQNLYPDINVIPPSRSRSPSASELQSLMPALLAGCTFSPFPLSVIKRRLNNTQGISTLYVW